MEFDAVLTSIAESLRDERLRAGLTLEQLAQKAELSTAHLSRLESGDRQPSVAALISLGRALRVPLSRLLGEHRQGSAISIYPPDEPTHEANGLTISGLSGFPGSSTLEALHITIDPDRVPPAPARHRGEEWIYVLTGHLRLEFEDEVHLLESGSAVHFDANRPHRLGAERVTTDVVVVAADSPNDLHNHPLFTSSFTLH
jgi:transcriptional regulator with XRE-family HTH domain